MCQDTSLSYLEREAIVTYLFSRILTGRQRLNYHVVFLHSIFNLVGFPSLSEP